MRFSAWVQVGVVALLGSLCACDPEPVRPGDGIRNSGKWLHNQMRWQTTDASGQNNIDGKIGYPLTVRGPTLDCPSGWTANVQIVQGGLPPGLSLANDFSITGTPTDRGHWIVTLRIDNIVCRGERYTPYGWAESLVVQRGERVSSECYPPGVTSDYGNAIRYCIDHTLRFHITGTGAVRI